MSGNITEIVHVQGVKEFFERLSRWEKSCKMLVLVVENVVDSSPVDRLAKSTEVSIACNFGYRRCEVEKEITDENK